MPQELSLEEFQKFDTVTVPRFSWSLSGSKPQESWGMSKIRYSHCSPIVMVHVLISDGCCLYPSHKNWVLGNVKNSLQCSPIVMVRAFISDGCCLYPSHKNWVLGNVKNSILCSPIVMVFVIDLRWLLSGSKPQELGLGECQKFDTVTVPPSVMVLVLISDGCCLDRCHKNWVLRNIKNSIQCSPIVMVLVLISDGCCL